MSRIRNFCSLCARARYCWTALPLICAFCAFKFPLFRRSSFSIYCFRYFYIEVLLSTLRIFHRSPCFLLFYTFPTLLVRCGHFLLVLEGRLSSDVIKDTTPSSLGPAFEAHCLLSRIFTAIHRCCLCRAM